MTFRHRWTWGEPDLHDMLRDDVIQAVMRRDGVSRQALDALISRARRQIHGPDYGFSGLPVAANDSAPRPLPR